MGGTKKSHLPEICFSDLTLGKLGTVIPYLKKIQKISKSRAAPLEFCWHQHFLARNYQFLLFWEIHIKIPFWNIFYNSFGFNWIQGCFNHYGSIFMMSAKLASQVSLKISCFEIRIMASTFLSITSSTNFMTWLKLYCRCGYVTKVS